MNALTFTLYDDITTYLYFNWTIFNYTYLNGNKYFSIFNIKPFWNVGLLICYIVPETSFLYGEEYNFGPFLSINYIPNFNFKESISSAGLLIYYTYPFVYTEIGYKRINNTNNFYISIMIDLPVIILGELLSGLF